MRFLAKLAALAVMVSLFVAAPLASASGDGNDRGDRGSKGHKKKGKGKKHRGKGSCDSDRGYRHARDDDYDGHKGDLDVVGLTADGRLICFESDDPRDARTVGTVSGLSGDTKLVGLDHRPATGDLYGLGDRGGVYTVDEGNAVAVKRSQLNVALAGSSFGVDFNPTVDRLRIISDTGQSLRANVDTGATLVDTTLTYPAAAGPPPVPATTGTGITGAAYTNNDSDPNTATTLYDIDSMLDQVVIQSPANAGLLAPTGKLGVDTSPTIGFDIYSKVQDGTTVDVDSFASLTVGGQARFFKIRLFTGRALPVGGFASKNQVTAIAIPLNQR